MSKLRVGIMVHERSRPDQGGGHSYYDVMLKGINDFDFHPDIEIINVVLYSKDISDFNLKKPSIFIKVRGKNNLKQSVKKTSKSFFNITLTRQNPVVNYFVSFFAGIGKRRVEKILKQHNIDIIYYLKHKWDVLNYSFIATHWDNLHKSLPPFPESTLDGNYERREIYHTLRLNKAFLILCESQAGVEELKKYHSFDESKFKVLPIFAGDVINLQHTSNFARQTLEQFNLEKGKFFIYPAQFWAHKNHYNLIIAFNKFLAENPDQDLKLVLCGTDKGNMTYIKQVIKSLPVHDRVIITGFVSADQLNVFFRNAIALTMATFLGPTNMPLIEAAHLNCAVLCSDLAGHKEIMQNNALYFDPASADSIAAVMKQIMETSFRDNLVASANSHIKQSPFNLGKSLIVLDQLLTGIIPVRKVWGIDYKVEEE